MASQVARTSLWSYKTGHHPWALLAVFFVDKTLGEGQSTRRLFASRPLSDWTIACVHTKGNFPLYCLEVPPSVMLPHAERFLVQLHAPLCRLLGSHPKIVYCAQFCQVLDLNLNLNLNVNLNLNLYNFQKGPKHRKASQCAYGPPTGPIFESPASYQS